MYDHPRLPRSANQTLECTAFKGSYELPEGQHGEKVPKETFVSQFHQDWLMYSAFFRQLELRGQRGTYLDVAAAWPRKLSNSYFFDVCQEWEGVCVEGDPAKVAELRRARNCRVGPTCVSDREETVTFPAMHATGGAGIKGLADVDKDHVHQFLRE